MHEILNEMKIRKHIRFEKYGRFMKDAKIFCLCETIKILILILVPVELIGLALC